MNTASIIRSVLVSGVLGLAALGSVAPASASTVIRQQVTQFDAFGNRITKTRIIKRDDFGNPIASGFGVSRTDAFGNRTTRFVKTDAFGRRVSGVRVTRLDAFGNPVSTTRVIRAGF